ncbi:MAG: glucan biosynthesis protein, partial [Halothiobacillaceae bacterium]
LRMGRGGEFGKERPANAKKIVIEWDGEILKSIPWGVRPTVVVSASRGQVSLTRSEAIWYTPRWRSEFDITVDGSEPVELRCHLELDGKPITETWLYQYHP